jgi:hypothetical protein
MWRYAMERIRDGATPKQAIVFLKDSRSRIHVRLIDKSSIGQLPRALTVSMNESLEVGGAPAGYWQATGAAAIVKPTLASSQPTKKKMKALPWISGQRPSAEELKRRGLLGELHVLGLLRTAYGEPAYRIDHVASADPFSPYDIRVILRRENRTVLFAEVKATVGQTKDPIQISERELRFRRRNKARHRIYIVYLRSGGRLPPRSCIELNFDNQFALEPRDYFLWPKIDNL